MTPEQLKASILQYAMEGKLVKQDTNDEPASILLEKIKAEKEKLVKEGKIKKSKKLPAIEEHEKPFDIPDSWEWVRLENILDVRDGTHGTPKYIDFGVPLITSKNISNGYLDFSNIKYISKIDADKIDQRSKVNKGDIIFAMIGTIGNPIIVDTNKRFSIKNVALLKCFSKYLNMQYILNYLYILQNVFKENSNGAVQKFISLNKIRLSPIPLPPLAEQKRIVAEIEKLMPLVDKYAEAYNRLQKIDGEFKDKLKQTILQYAMEGKLVKQDTNDEPASILLEKIKAEKEKLVKEGKIKKSKKLPAIEEEEKPFDIPDSWEWVRLEDVCDYIQRGKSPKYDKANKNYPIISQKCNQWSGISLEYAKFLAKEFWNSLEEYRFVRQEDVLLNSTGLGTVGRVGLLAKSFNKVPVDSHVTIIRHNHFMTGKYIYYFMMSPLIQSNLKNYLSGSTKQKEFSRNTVINLVLPLPPLAEQKRIVAKIDRMMIQIDEIQ